MSSPAPRATAFGVISTVLSWVSSVPRSASSLSASGFPPAAVPLVQSRYSSLCQPVHFGSFSSAKSSTRASTAPSISSTSPATGSIRSQLTRLGADRVGEQLGLLAQRGHLAQHVRLVRRHRGGDVLVAALAAEVGSGQPGAG